jgi:hypothetical protein
MECAVSCAICNTRKEKRFCPAMHARICPICCGTEREVSLDCPLECPYLQQARRQETMRDLSEMDHQALFVDVKIAPEVPYRRESLIAGLSFSLAQVARHDRTLHDGDVIAALTSLAKTYQTLAGSGLVYEPATANPAQQQMTGELEKMIAGYREVEQKQLGATSLRDSEVLQVLVFMLRLALSRTNGRPRSRAFLEMLFQQFPQEKAVVSPDEPGSLIVP